MAQTPDVINPNEIKTRDPLVLALIGGATKAAVHVDRKRQAKRDACRKYDSRRDSD